jgi:hypothetical protein
VGSSAAPGALRSAGKTDWAVAKPVSTIELQSTDSPVEPRIRSVESCPSTGIVLTETAGSQE